jgi:hypothetical protein
MDHGDPRVDARKVGLQNHVENTWRRQTGRAGCILVTGIGSYAEGFTVVDATTLA